MARNKEIKHLREENRGLKKRIKHISDASTNNYTGMMYWKNKFNQLADLTESVVKVQAYDHTLLKNKIKDD